MRQARNLDGAGRNPGLRLLEEAHGLRRFRFGEKRLFLFELGREQARLFVPRQERIGDHLDFRGVGAGELEAVLQRLPREPVLELDPGEAFLAGGVDDPAVLHQRDRGVLVERRETEHFH
jgi:hypothetical protein